MSFAGVIFDMDGVLCDSEDFMAEAAAAMFAETYKITVAVEEFRPFRGMGEDRYLGGVAKNHGITLDLPVDKQRAYEIFLERIPGRLQPLPGAVKFIASCRARGLKLANQTDLVLKDLEASLVDLEKMRDMAKSLQQLQQQSEKLGKDLAEQLKNGQPEMAQATLQKMISQLKSANLSSNQLQQLLQEVSKAVDPAGNYGKVADHLQTASQQMQAGNKSDAAQSLAAAAKELGSLMQQMGDAQAMMASLDNLNQASMCIGSGQGWGTRTGNKPGYNPNGNRPGGGVGTWSDSSAQWDGQWSDHWDNSGLERPDQDAMGHTDRGEGELSDALKPTKVKGQFKPGGQMPSITLKGVSIKGQSKVAYEQAATAAQSDAQSALSQEKVPRAYQGAVKDYFDDLKK